MKFDAWITALALSAGFFVFTQSGCRTAKHGKRIAPPEVVSPSAAVPATSVPASFLATNYADLAGWFEERFEVEYRNMTPPLVFDQQPISDIHYDLKALPTNAPLFHLQDPNISRREILYRVAKYWDLDMKIVEVDGKPSVLSVTGSPSVRVGGS